MTKLAVWMRSARRYPALAWYSVRHAEHRLRIGAQNAQEVVLVAYQGARRQAYKALGRPEPLPVSIQREQLLEFYERYEDLVDLLCNAARFEDPEAFEGSYARLREWMLRHYPTIRPYLIAHLKLDPIDDAFGLNVRGKPTDGFEALFVAPSLGQALKHDQGDLIDRFQRTRSALNRYGDHLRRQSVAPNSR